MDWQKVLSRLSVPGLTLLLVGILLCLNSAKLCALALGDRAERAVTPLKLFGLVLAILGAAILLDLIPGL